MTVKETRRQALLFCQRAGERVSAERIGERREWIRAGAAGLRDADAERFGWGGRIGVDQGRRAAIAEQLRGAEFTFKAWFSGAAALVSGAVAPATRAVRPDTAEVMPAEGMPEVPRVPCVRPLTVLATGAPPGTEETMAGRPFTSGVTTGILVAVGLAMLAETIWPLDKAFA